MVTVTKLAPIIDPSVRKPSPKPVRVDLRKVFMVGTSLWAVGLVICMILLALGFDVERGQTMCAAGTVIGVLMLLWEHFDRWDCQARRVAPVSSARSALPAPMAASR